MVAVLFADGVHRDDVGVVQLGRGLRFALGIMWLTLIVAETIAASSGLGYMAMQAREFMQIDVVVLSILIYALLGKVADSASRALERLTLSWHPAFSKH